jgi:hypothetical protein
MSSVGNWNLENLFQPGSTFGPEDHAAYQAKLETLAAVTRSASMSRRWRKSATPTRSPI